MHWIVSFIALILFHICPVTLSASSSNLETETSYPQNPYVDPDLWENLTPYFLPEDHPVKEQLDEIFSSGQRVLLNQDTLVEAGFTAPKPGHKLTRPYVLKHPKLKGYLVKMFTDDNKVTEWEQWVRRIKGAYYTQECIDKHGYQKYFSVPKKWIYPIPVGSASAGEYRKNFILVVQNMKILKKNENKRTWKSMAVNPYVLDALYTVVDEVGLADSLFVFNIPFSRIDGKISFIDTEDYHIWPINYERMKNYLSPALQIYWDMLIENEGPRK